MLLSFVGLPKMGFPLLGARPADLENCTVVAKKSTRVSPSEGSALTDPELKITVKI